MLRTHIVRRTNTHRIIIHTYAEAAEAPAYPLGCRVNDAVVASEQMPGLPDRYQRPASVTSQG